MKGHGYIFTMDKNQLRQIFRERRRALSSSEQYAASHSITEQFFSSNVLNSCQHIALYIACDGEIDLTPLKQQLWENEKSCYLPIVHEEKLRFSTYTHTTHLIANRYSILEPEAISPSKLIKELDLILMPLVAFTQEGHRLGMGAGYYDKTLSQYDVTQRPLLIGCAHDIQCAKSLPQDNWDIQLDGILTPTRIILLNDKQTIRSSE